MLIVTVVQQQKKHYSLTLLDALKVILCIALRIKCGGKHNLRRIKCGGKPRNNSWKYTGHRDRQIIKFAGHGGFFAGQSVIFCCSQSGSCFSLDSVSTSRPDSFIRYSQDHLRSWVLGTEHASQMVTAQATHEYLVFGR